MGDYRVFLLDARNRVTGVEIIKAESDEDALALAKQYIDGHDVEIWKGDKSIGRLNRGD